MINVILLILGLCVLGLLVMIVYAALKPTDATRVVVEEKTLLKLEYLDHDKAVMSFEVPLRNKSPESAAVTDCFVRPYLPQEQFPDAWCTGNVEKSDRRRNDHYFEALVLKEWSEWTLIVTLTLRARNGKDMREILNRMVDMDAAIFVCGVGRKAHYVRKYFFTVFADELKKLAGGAYNG
ncbi:hypothetical protein [Acidaminococcus massiliensis]